jgi:PadR family transcriptional regulator, regulatory protein AphA
MRPENPARFALLGLLQDQPHHGYDLYQRFGDPVGLGQVWHLGMSQMYAELKTLQARGWVSLVVEQQDPRPAKKIFSLTSKGRGAFEEWMAAPSRGLREMRVEFIAKLYFARLKGVRDISALVACQEKSLREELGKLQKEKASPHGTDGYVLAVHTFRTGQIKAAMEWLKSIRKQAGRR